MDHVFDIVLGQSPAPRSRPKGPEPLAGAQRVAQARATERGAASESAHDAARSTPESVSDAGQRRGSNQTAAAAVTIEAAIGVRDEAELTAAELSRLTKLQQRDQEVRSHEQAHIAAGGGHVVGGARYTHTQGPDGRQYAVSGEVSIDASKVPGDPDATIEKAKTVRRAALAPAQPSGQDQAVAAKAQTMETEARMELLQQRRGTGLAAYRAADAETGRHIFSFTV